MRMTVDLTDRRVALLGGDTREVVLAYALADAGANVVTCGFRRSFDHPRICRVSGVIEAVTGAAGIIAPMTNTDENGRIKAVEDPDATLMLDEAAFRAMEPGTPLFIGVAKPVIRHLAQRYKIRLIQSSEVDSIAILNSIPTAEGAIQLAMERLPVTIHQSAAAVIGFGRCGITLARMLHALGADTLVLARRAAQQARAEEMGLKTAPWSDLPAALSDREVIFNTVPALVLNRSVLQQLRRDCVIIDIASEPGGVDFAAADQLGIKAYLELGLPGRVAPLTAGRILARTIPAMLAEVLEESERG